MGVAAAFVFPASLAILTDIFTDPSERQKALGVWGATSGIAVAFGPIVGGALLEHFWFGSIFLVNVPIVLVTLVSGHFLIPRLERAAARRFDTRGVLVSTVGLTLLVLAIIQGPQWGWTSTATLGCFAGAASLLTAFAFLELHTAEPLLDVRVFAIPRFSSGAVSIAVAFFCLFGFIFVITQFFQFVKGYSTLSAGVHTLPFAIVAAVVHPGRGRARPPGRDTPRGRRRTGADGRRSGPGRGELNTPGRLLRPGHHVHGPTGPRSLVRSPRRPPRPSWGRWPPSRSAPAPRSTTPPGNSGALSGWPCSARCSPPRTGLGSSTPWPAIRCPPRPRCGPPVGGRRSCRRGPRPIRGAADDSSGGIRRIRLRPRSRLPGRRRRGGRRRDRGLRVPARAPAWRDRRRHARMRRLSLDARRESQAVDEEACRSGGHSSRSRVAIRWSRGSSSASGRPCPTTTGARPIRSSRRSGSAARPGSRRVAPCTPTTAVGRTPWRSPPHG